MSVPIKQLQFFGISFDILKDDGNIETNGECKIHIEAILEKINNISFIESCTKNEEEVIKELLSQDFSNEASLRLIRDVIKHKEWDDVKLISGLDNIVFKVDFDIEIEKDFLIIKYSKK